MKSSLSNTPLSLTLLILLLFWTPLTLGAQSVVNGVVKHESSLVVIPGAVVSLINEDDSKTLAYQVSKSDGSFMLKVSNKVDQKVILSVKALGYKNYEKVLALKEKDHRIVDVFLEESVTVLEEIVVKQSSISQQGDTISYLANLFRKTDDRTLSDLLERLPGLSVSSTGQISYNGEPISKFYVEGLDLLQGKYGIAAQNVDIDQVASIQVLENHQPLRILKDIEVPTAAAINIKLKRSALGAFFGKAKLGAGLPTKHLFSNEFSIMRFANQQQNMLVLKQDNSGRDIGIELTDQYLDWSPSVPQFLSLTRNYPPIDERYTRKNNLFFGSYNNLLLIDSLSTLTVNVDYKYDRLTYAERRERQVYQPSGGIYHLIEESKSREKENAFSAKINFERNTETKYIQNKTTLQKKSNKWDGGVWVNGAMTALLLNTPSFEVNNSFSLMNSADNGGLSLKWNASYMTTLNQLEVSPFSSHLAQGLISNHATEDNLIANQELNYSSFSTQLKIAKTYRRSQGSADLYANVDYGRHMLDSRLLLGSEAAKNGLNDIIYNTLPLQIGTSLRYNSLKWFVNLNIPIIYHFTKSRIEELHYFRFLPTLTLNYRPSINWDLSLYAAHRDEAPSYTDEMTGVVLLNNNMLMSRDLKTPKKNIMNLGGRIHYKNIQKAFFMTLWVNSSTNWMNSLADVSFEDNAFNLKLIAYPHRTTSWNIGAEVDWYLRALGTKISLNPQMILANSKAVRDHKPIDIQNRIYSIVGSADMVPLEWLRTRYIGKVSLALHQVAHSDETPRQDQSHTLSLSLFPTKGLEIQGKLTYTSTRIQRQYSDALLGDLTMSYVFNKHFEVVGEWNNVFNSSSLIVTEPISSDILSTLFYFRPSEVLFRCIFTF